MFNRLVAFVVGISLLPLSLSAAPPPLALPVHGCPATSAAPAAEQLGAWSAAGYTRHGEYLQVKEDHVFRTYGGDGLTLYLAASHVEIGLSLDQEIFAVGPTANTTWPDSITFSFRPRDSARLSEVIHRTCMPDGSSQPGSTPSDAPLAMQLYQLGFVSAGGDFYERATRAPGTEFGQNWLLRVEGNRVTRVYTSVRQEAQGVLRREGLLATRTVTSDHLLFLTTAGAYRVRYSGYLVDQWRGTQRLRLAPVVLGLASWEQFHLDELNPPEQPEGSLVTSQVRSRYGRWSVRLAANGTISFDLHDIPPDQMATVQGLVAAAARPNLSGQSVAIIGQMLALDGGRDQGGTYGMGRINFINALLESLPPAE